MLCIYPTISLLFPHCFHSICVLFPSYFSLFSFLLPYFFVGAKHFWDLIPFHLDLGPFNGPSCWAWPSAPLLVTYSIIQRFRPPSPSQLFSISTFCTTSSLSHLHRGSTWCQPGSRGHSCGFNIWHSPTPRWISSNFHFSIYPPSRETVTTCNET